MEPCQQPLLNGMNALTVVQIGATNNPGYFIVPALAVNNLPSAAGYAGISFSAGHRLANRGYAARGCGCQEIHAKKHVSLISVALN